MRAWFQRNTMPAQKLLVLLLVCASCVLVAHSYSGQVQAANNKIGLLPDEAVHFVKVEKLNQVQLFAFSSRFLESSVLLTVTGENIYTIPAKPTWRGLSKSDRDPQVTVFPRNAKLPMSFQSTYTYHVGMSTVRPVSSYHYKLPFQETKQFIVGQGYFGHTHTKGNHNQYAVDFGLPENTFVCAARNGTVIGFRDDSTAGGPEERFSNSANYLVIKHDDDSLAEYFHLKRDGVLVKLGDKIEAGQIIGLSGNTGQSSGPHLHFGVYYYDNTHQRHSLPTSFKTAAGINNSPHYGQTLSHPKPGNWD